MSQSMGLERAAEGRSNLLVVRGDKAWKTLEVDTLPSDDEGQDEGKKSSSLEEETAPRGCASGGELRTKCQDSKMKDGGGGFEGRGEES